MIGNQIIKADPCSKFLGLFIDNDLKFTTHIESLCRKLASGCHAIRIVSKNLDLCTTKSVYYSLIESHLRYGICFWGACPQYLFNMLFILQKRAVRYLFGLKTRDSCKPYFISHKILTLPCLYVLETVCMIHKKYKGEIISTSLHGTRQGLFIPLPIPTTTLVKDSFVYNGKKMFNHLPRTIRIISDERKFRREVRELLVARAYYVAGEFLDDGFV